MGVYGTALWMVQRHVGLASLADPQHDLSCIEAEIQVAAKRGKKTNPGVFMAADSFVEPIPPSP